jgi:branched-chain amino acid transport system substrate-binding protein
MQRVAWLRGVAVVAVLVLAATACGGDGGTGAQGTETGGEETETAGEETETSSPTDGGTQAAGDRNNVDEELKVGTVLPQTGDLASLGPPIAAGVNLALQQINEAGGVLGTDVVLTEADSGTNESVASDSVNQLLRDNVDAMIGAASSRISLSIIDRVTGSEVAQCSPSNTGATFTNYEDSDPGYYFRTAPPDNLQGPALAQTITQDGFSQVGIIALNDEYGQGFAEFLSQALDEAGATVVANVAYDPAGTEFSADVQKLAEANPDAVALIGFPDTGSTILQEMISQGLGPENIGVYGADGMKDKGVAENVDPETPSVVAGLKGTAPSSQGSEQFTSAFEEFAPDTQSIFSAHAYDCMNLMAMAAQQAGTDDPREFRSEIVDLTKDGEQCTDFASCKAIIDEGGNPDYQGATGDLNFASPGEPGAGDYQIWELQVGDGGTATIESLETLTVEGSDSGEGNS